MSTHNVVRTGDFTTSLIRIQGFNFIAQKKKAAGFFSTYNLGLESESVFINELSRCNPWCP
jgi:hypothetical protein